MTSAILVLQMMMITLFIHSCVTPSYYYSELLTIDPQMRHERVSNSFMNSDHDGWNLDDCTTLYGSVHSIPYSLNFKQTLEGERRI